MFQVRTTRSRWFQFSLVTMFLLVTAFVVWLEWRVNCARQLAAAVACKGR